MKNKLKIISASILILSVSAAIFSSCGVKTDDESTTQNTAETSVVYGTDYTYSPIENITKEQTKYVHTVPAVPTDSVRSETKAETEKTSAATLTSTTKKAVPGGTVDEISSGITLITKSFPVLKGSSATVMIQGNPNAKYTIIFYETDSKTASYSGLGEISADSNGIASWNFSIDESCSSGEHKIIIREKNSDNYIQTSIVVQ